MRAPAAPPAIDVGVTAGWVVGSCVVAFCAGFSATVLFELAIYDIPEIASWWDLDVLIGALAAWVTLMSQSALRLRVDDHGVHRRSLLRRRSTSWADVSELAVVPPRLRLVSEVLSFRTDDRWLRTASGLNTHAGGAPALLELAAPHAGNAGVAVSAPEETA